MPPVSPNSGLWKDPTSPMPVDHRLISFCAAAQNARRPMTGPAAPERDTIVCMRAIMTVTGLDHTGIIAAVSGALAERDVNITNVSQTLMGNYFTMILQIDFDDDVLPLVDLQRTMTDVGKAEGLEIRIQSEAIFDAMHKL